MVHLKKIPASLFPFLFLCIGTTAAGGDGAPDAGHVGTQKKRLHEIREELRRKKSREEAASRREESILGTLSRMERDLLQRERELRRLDARHDRMRKDIMSVQQRLNRIQHAIDRNRNRLHSRIVAMYKMGRIGYLPCLLSSDSYNDFMKMFTYLRIVIDHDANLLRDYQAQWLKKRQYHEKLETEIRELERIRVEQEGKKSEILRARKEKRIFLQAVRKRRVGYKRLIRELEERARELHLLIKKLEEEARDRRVSSSNLRVYKGKLSMPVHGTIIPGKRGRGIIIQAPKGSPVRAVFPGTVIYSGWFEGYGNIVILDHGDKYYTVFAHASKVLKRVNERVVRGEVIALVGDTASITGPSLYFEVRHKGKPEDPLEWLSMPRDFKGSSGIKKGSVSAGGKG